MADKVDKAAIIVTNDVRDKPDFPMGQQERDLARPSQPGQTHLKEDSNK